MSALFIVIPLTLVLLAVAVGVFIWCVNSGQFDDLDSAAYLPVTDDRPRTPPRSDRAPGTDGSSDDSAR